MTEERHHERFAEAVDRKKKAAKEASEHAPRPDGGSEIEGDQPDLTSPARPQDEYSTRAKGSQHKKVTADKWNQ